MIPPPQNRQEIEKFLDGVDNLIKQYEDGDYSMIYLEPKELKFMAGTIRTLSAENEAQAEKLRIAVAALNKDVSRLSTLAGWHNDENAHEWAVESHQALSQLTPPPTE